MGRAFGKYKAGCLQKLPGHGEERAGLTDAFEEAPGYRKGEKVPGQGCFILKLRCCYFNLAERG